MPKYYKGWTKASIQRIIEDIRSTKCDNSPHLTPEELDAVAKDEISLETNENLRKHIDWCGECADEIIARAEGWG